MISIHGQDYSQKDLMTVLAFLPIVSAFLLYM